MTDNEIIKALECVSGKVLCCRNCPYSKKFPQPTKCKEACAKDALDLINRQKAEIERFADRNHKCIYLSDEETTEYCVDGPCPKFKTEEQIRAETVKYFDVRFKERVSYDLYNMRYIIDGRYYDNLVKEFTEGKDNGK